MDTIIGIITLIAIISIFPFFIFSEWYGMSGGMHWTEIKKRYKPSFLLQILLGLLPYRDTLNPDNGVVYYKSLFGRVFVLGSFTNECFVERDLKSAEFYTGVQQISEKEYNKSFGIEE